MDIMQNVTIFAIAVLGVTEIYIYYEIMKIEMFEYGKAMGCLEPARP